MNSRKSRSNNAKLQQETKKWSNALQRLPQRLMTDDSSAQAKLMRYLKEAIRVNISLKPGLRYDGSISFWKEEYLSRYRTGKDILKSSGIFPIINTMPKGGHLHVHLLASLNCEFVVLYFLEDPRLMYCVDPAHEENLYGAFSLSREIGNGWEQATDARMILKFLKYQGMTAECIDMERSRDPTDIVSMWDVLERCTGRAGELLKHEEAFEVGFANCLTEHRDVGYSFIEFRASVTNIRSKVNVKKKLTGEQTLALMNRVHASVSDAPNFGIIISFGKGTAHDVISCDTVKDQVMAAFDLTNGLYSRRHDANAALLLARILGVDMYGEEDVSRRTSSFLPLLQDLESRANNIGFGSRNWQYYLHAGENYFPYRKNQNIELALRLQNTRRIGHGLRLGNVGDWQSIRDVLIERNIGVEICPLSNQILGYVPNVSFSPGFHFFRDKIAVSVSSDDNYIYGYANAVLDFVAIAYAWNLGLGELKQLAVNSMKTSVLGHSMLEDGTFEKKWQEWIDKCEVWIIEKSRIPVRSDAATGDALELERWNVVAKNVRCALARGAISGQPVFLADQIIDSRRPADGMC